MASPYSRTHLRHGIENLCYFGTEPPAGAAGNFVHCLDRWQAFNQARIAARIFAGMEDTGSVPFVQAIGPWKGWAGGSQSIDGLRGWRLDFDMRGRKGFHINWWDHTLDPSGRNRSRRLYGANVIVGEGLQMFWEMLSHFPGHVQHAE
jgi:hypothetical protein